MVSDIDDTQPTMISKDNSIDRKWTGNTPPVQPYDISDDEVTAGTL